MSGFTSNQNLELLWEVLLDELKINKITKQHMSNIRIIFERNIQPFVSSNHKTTNIIELNKLFLSQILIAIDKLMPNLRSEINFKKINISDEAYKIEDIQQLRQTSFESELEAKRKELDTYLTPQKPKNIDFSFEANDGKIKSMDTLIADKLKQRDTELDLSVPTIEVETWLKPKDTSIHTDNNVKLTIDSISNTKHVTWDDEKEPSSLSIFSKLKKIDNYEEQRSMPLPEVKQEQIIQPVNVVQSNKTDPLIPKSELAKQLNDMNDKLNDMHVMISKILENLENSNKN